MELRFAQVDRRFSDVDQRFDEMQATTINASPISTGVSKSRSASWISASRRRQRRTDQQFASLEKLMMAKFDDVDKRIRLLAAATGVGFAMVIGFLSAIVVLVA